ncbi:UBX domain-containing protein 4-like [Carassius carassius]|uniref:UBX domain-containing protein 4-like n=1 Tax=Carassius carassius TaxID=217509 RepID=UPI0028692A97|nr:UBX domain-containing protein 4-like [Carassius carassius]
MRWFEGSIPAAIAAAKERRCVFVVVITGSDDQSAQLMSSWEADSVCEAAQNCCVAIRVDAESETCVQFSQIYPVVCIPSSFFIGENGVPLEVIAGSVTEDELQRRISRVTQMHTQQMSAERANQTPISEPQAKESLSESMEEDGASGHVTPGEDEPLDTKVERITKKLEERREQKKKAEEENELKKEMERRKMGKEMLDFKHQQEEEKTKRLLEERNREKAEERAARERVKQQIALDRADRAARLTQTQLEADTSRTAALQARATEQDVQIEKSAFARIQFRLPDGSSVTNQFPSETRLLEARQFAAREVGKRYGQFSLATMFPRREFTAEDLQRTLLELDLTPSACIVLLPQSRSAVVRSSASGGVWAALESLLYPLLSVWRLISGFLFSSAPPAPAPAAAYNTHGSGAAAEPQRDVVRKRVLEKKPEDFKKDGKIYRLRTQEDNEDDNNTWNGNSTQQM